MSIKHLYNFSKAAGLFHCINKIKKPLFTFCKQRFNLVSFCNSLLPGKQRKNSF